MHAASPFSTDSDSDCFSDNFGTTYRPSTQVRTQNSRSLIPVNFVEISRGINNNAILPRWKIVLAGVGALFGVLLATTLIVLAYYTGNGTLHAADWVVTGLKYSAWIVGGATLLTIPFVIAAYFHEAGKLKLKQDCNNVRNIEQNSNPHVFNHIDSDLSDEESVIEIPSTDSDS